MKIALLRMEQTYRNAKKLDGLHLLLHDVGHPLVVVVVVVQAHPLRLQHARRRVQSWKLYWRWIVIVSPLSEIYLLIWNMSKKFNVDWYSCQILGKQILQSFVYSQRKEMQNSEMLYKKIWGKIGNFSKFSYSARWLYNICMYVYIWNTYICFDLLAV